jgi:hypothetical protein
MYALGPGCKNVGPVRRRPGARGTMTYRLIIFFCMALVLRSAGAIDIPINRNLAMQALDSKTCYGTIKSRGKLVGYELNSMGLLVSSSGKLVALKATGTVAIGERKPRRYVGPGMEVTITPHQVASHADDVQQLYIVLEEGFAIVSDHGRRQRFQVKVSEICTP